MLSRARSTKRAIVPDLVRLSEGRTAARRLMLVAALFWADRLMDRRAFVARSALALASLVPLPRVVCAADTDRTSRIGCLSFGARPVNGEVPAALREGLRERGYVEGRNAVYIGRWAEAKRDRLPALAADLVAQRPDVIVTFTGRATTAMKAATSTIPIVFTNASDPVRTGLVASLSRPGANVTGITDQAIDLSAKRLDLLKELVPRAERVAVLWNADNAEMTLRFEQIESAASLLQVRIQPLGVREPEDFKSAFAAMDRERPDALLLVTDSLTVLNRRLVLEYATAHNIPAMYEYAYMVREGGLISYGPDFDDLYRRAAVYVDRILKGAKPNDLPVEQPTNYYLLVNVRTAKQLGLTVPQSLLLRANQVIE